MNKYKAITAENNKGRLVVIVESEEEMIKTGRCTIVPAFKVDKDRWIEEGKRIHRIINKAESVGYVLVDNPIERDLPEIIKLEEE